MMSQRLLASVFSFRFARVMATVAVLGAVPAVAFGQSSSGVQIIDMNPSPRPHKSAASPARVPKPTPVPALPGASALVRNAMAYVGAPVRRNGMSPAGFDAAGFTAFAFQSIGRRIPRGAAQQFYAGRDISGDPLPGDLVFFQTTAYGPSDVGLYVGDGRFIAASGPAVHVDAFTSDYYRGRYLGARRYL